ncbi:MAG: hypothetical protein Q8N36_06710, partial [bacterium]|nr:hypothetical protein [bacterium]
GEPYLLQAMRYFKKRVLHHPDKHLPYLIDCYRFLGVCKHQQRDVAKIWIYYSRGMGEALKQISVAKELESKIEGLIIELLLVMAAYGKRSYMHKASKLISQVAYMLENTNIHERVRLENAWYNYLLDDKKTEQSAERLRPADDMWNNYQLCLDPLPFFRWTLYAIRCNFKEEMTRGVTFFEQCAKNKSGENVVFLARWLKCYYQWKGEANSDDARFLTGLSILEREATSIPFNIALCHALKAVIVAKDDPTSAHYLWMDSLSIMRQIDFTLYIYEYGWLIEQMESLLPPDFLSVLKVHFQHMLLEMSK